ncbi:MAG TPA: hypothetical protein VHY91_23445 [Pirellulales bacterium]|jgi:hypothetical protein|nr:hypothetical protein [Pirellulales bacterium]
MRIHLLLSALTLLFVAGGCCGSNQPLYTPETIKQDVDLAGTWEFYDVELKKFDTEHPVRVEALGEGKFEARWTENLGDAKYPRLEKHAAIVRAVELEGSLYLDLELIHPEEDSLSVILTGQHSIALAHLQGDRLGFAFLDRKKVQECKAETTVRFASGWGWLTLDEPTAGLQKFVAAYRDRIFEPAGGARRIAKPQAAD